MKDLIPLEDGDRDAWADIDQDVSWLPLIDYWGARQIEATISVDAAGGALLGVLITPPLLLTARALRAYVTRLYGWSWGYVGFLLGWMLAAYVALVLIANWQALGEESEYGQGK